MHAEHQLYIHSCRETPAHRPSPSHGRISSVSCDIIISAALSVCRGRSIAPDLSVFVDLFRLRHCGKKRRTYELYSPEGKAAECLRLNGVCKCSLIIRLKCYFVFNSSTCAAILCRQARTNAYWGECHSSRLAKCISCYETETKWNRIIKISLEYH